MIKSKKFSNQTELNNFVEFLEIKVINIETLSERYDTGLPLVDGSGRTFVTNREVLKLWYEETVVK